MKLPHLSLALLVVFIWGMNLIVARWALNDFPPLFLVFSRFFLVSIPAIFFIKRPKVHWRLLFSYAMFMFLLTFSLSFFGIQQGVAPDLASILLQSQAFFTVFIGWAFLKEKIHIWQLLGGLVGLAGIAFIGVKTQGTATTEGVVLIMLGALTWGIGNGITKKIRTANFVSVIVWAACLCTPLSFLLSYFLEGPEKISTSLQNLNLADIGVLLYLSYGSILLTFICWSYLLRSYPLATISPLTFACPLIAMAGATLFLGEPLESWKLIAAGVILFGLAIDFVGTRFFLPKTEKF